MGFANAYYEADEAESYSACALSIWEAKGKQIFQSYAGMSWENNWKLRQFSSKECGAQVSRSIALSLDQQIHLSDENEFLGNKRVPAW